MTITAAADGSALGNPGPAGWAWYVDDAHWGAGGWKHATNNQGELKAVLELFRSTAHLDDDLLVLCDSQYVINCVTKWMRGWKAKGWRKGDGKPVMNVDLLKEIDEAIIGRRYRFEWVKGHANHPLNEAADERARAVAEAFQRGRSVPAGPGWAGSSAPATATATAAASATATMDSTADAGSGVGRATSIAEGSAAFATADASSRPSVAVSQPTRLQPSLFTFEEPFDEPLDDLLVAGAPPAPVGAATVRLAADDYRALERAATRRSIRPEELLARLIRGLDAQ